MRKFRGTIGALLVATILASSFAVPVMAAEELPDQPGEEPVITEQVDVEEPEEKEEESGAIEDENDSAQEDVADDGEDEIQEEVTPDAEEIQEPIETNTVTVDEAAISPATDILDDEATIESQSGQLRGKVLVKCEGEEIHGNVEVGKTLTADTSLVTAPEGAVLSYQWFKEKEGAEEEIAGANEASYKTTEDDFGYDIYVKVTSDLTANEISAGWNTVSRLCSVIVQLKSVPYSGGGGAVKEENLGDGCTRYTNWVGETSTIHLEVESLKENETFEGWFVDGGTEPASTESYFTYTYGDIEKLVAKVTKEGETPTPTPTKGVTLSGWQGGSNAVVDEPITVVLGSDVPEGTITYQWIKDNAPIEGATSASYTPVAEDENYPLSVEVTITPAEGDPLVLKSSKSTVIKLCELIVTYRFGGGSSGTKCISEERISADITKRVFKTRAGQEVTLIAGSRNGYKFIGWYEGEKCVSTDERLIYIFGSTTYKTLETRFEQIDTYELTVSDPGIFTRKEGQSSGTSQNIRLQNNGTGHLNLSISVVPDNDASQDAFILSDDSMRVVGQSTETLRVTASTEKAVGEYSAKLVITDTEHNIRIQKPLKLKVLSADAAEPVITARLIGAPSKIKLRESLPEMSVELTYNYGKDADGQDIIETQTIKVASNMIRNYDRNTVGNQTVTINLSSYNARNLTFDVEVVNYIRSISYRDNHQYQWGTETTLRKDGMVSRIMADSSFGDRISATDSRITFGQPDFTKLGTQETTITYTDNSDPDMPISITNYFKVHVKNENKITNTPAGAPSVNVGTATLKKENGGEVAADDVKLIVKGIESTDQAKVDEIIDNTPNVTEENSMQIEIRLETDGGEKVQPDNGSISLFLPYPSGTNANYAFTLIHVLGSSTQTVAVTKEANGIRFTVSSLSPFVLTWQEGSGSDTPAPEPDDTTSSNRPGNFFYSDDSDDSDSSDNSSTSYTKPAAPTYGDGTSKNLRTKEVKASAISKAVKQKAAGKTAKLYIADNATISKAVVGKMTEPVTFMGLNYYVTLDPAKITEKLDIKLRVYPSAPRAQQTFEKYFKEPVAAISCAQRGSYGMRAYIDIKPDKLSNIDTGKPMYVFSWNPEKNSYKRVGTAILLKNGWIRCYTDRGYDLVVSNFSTFTSKK